ncbi:hypothetical protein ACQKLP_15320 [Chitinophaga sp. NPDC101104]|uniref:hypothetical protein n=1 Tax=Chitinophaga sp. NPDC101104 TaxID=3390561 RepID=UPI003D022D4A
MKKGVCFVSILLSCFLMACITESGELKLININKSVELDTLETDSVRRLMIVRIVDQRALGKFRQSYAIIGNDGTNCKGYKFDISGKLGFRISSTLISFVRPFGVANWGWYSVHNGEIGNTLPGVSDIIGKLHADFEGCFVSESNGYFSVFKNGKLIRSFNYGNWAVLSSAEKFDSLKPGLYILEDSRLKRVSDNADDLFKQKEGVFFIPSPGYGVVASYSKLKLLDMIGDEMKKKRPAEVLHIVPE